MSFEDRARLQKAVDFNPQEACVWLKSSGTESSSKGDKLVCLSKESILDAAKSVNHFFQITAQDRWLSSIPDFHIGGLSIYARCFLAKAQVVSFSAWNVASFVETLEQERITITSLVPTQVFDLVESRRKAPSTLRFILVGGGALKIHLYEKARELGWPLIPSYGMTETSALMASADLESLKSKNFPKAMVLPHVKIRTCGKSHSIEGVCLFRGFLFVNSDGSAVWKERPRPFLLDDHIELEGDFIKVLGRDSELVKILGETVNLKSLSLKFEEQLEQFCVIIPVENSRKGYDLVLVTEKAVRAQELSCINERLMPFERINKTLVIKAWPRTELGKVKIAEVKAWVTASL